MHLLDHARRLQDVPRLRRALGPTLLTACCGAPSLPRPFQCVHEWQRFLVHEEEQHDRERHDGEQQEHHEGDAGPDRDVLHERESGVHEDASCRGEG